MIKRDREAATELVRCTAIRYQPADEQVFLTFVMQMRMRPSSSGLSSNTTCSRLMWRLLFSDGLLRRPRDTRMPTGSSTARTKGNAHAQRVDIRYAHVRKIACRRTLHTRDEGTRKCLHASLVARIHYTPSRETTRDNSRR